MQIKLEHIHSLAPPCGGLRICVNYVNTQHNVMCFGQINIKSHVVGILSLTATQQQSN